MTRPIKLILEPLIKTAFQKRGFSSSQLILDWEKIMGQTVADYSWPLKIAFPLHRRSKGTLHLNVISSWATLVDQNRTLYMERINTFFGYDCIATIKIHQQSAKPKKTLGQPIPPLSKEKQQHIEQVLENFEDSPLKTTLQSLGEAILKRQER